MTMFRRATVAQALSVVLKVFFRSARQYLKWYTYLIGKPDVLGAFGKSFDFLSIIISILEEEY